MARKGKLQSHPHQRAGLAASNRMRRPCPEPALSAQLPCCLLPSNCSWRQGSAWIYPGRQGRKCWLAGSPHRCVRLPCEGRIVAAAGRMGAVHHPGRRVAHEPEVHGIHLVDLHDLQDTCRLGHGHAKPAS